MRTSYGTDPHRVLILDISYLARIGPLLIYNHSRHLPDLVRDHFTAQRLRTLRSLFQEHGSAEAARRARVPRTVLTQELRSKNPAEALPAWVEIDYTQMATDAAQPHAYVRDLRQTQAACAQIISQTRTHALRQAVEHLGVERVAALTGMHPATVAERTEVAVCDLPPVRTPEPVEART